MGIFSSIKPWKEGDRLPIKLANGDDWPPKGAQGFTSADQFKFTAEKRKLVGVPSVDMESYMQASYATAIGFPADEVMIAWGQLLVMGLPFQKKFKVVNVAISENIICLWWGMGPVKLIEVFLASFDAIQGVEPVSALLADVQFKHAQYSGQDGNYSMTMPILEIGPHIARDAHANRRSLECHYSMSEMIKSRFIQ